MYSDAVVVNSTSGESQLLINSMCIILFKWSNTTFPALQFSVLTISHSKQFFSQTSSQQMGGLRLCHRTVASWQNLLSSFLGNEMVCILISGCVNWRNHSVRQTLVYYFYITLTIDVLILYKRVIEVCCTKLPFNEVYYTVLLYLMQYLLVALTCRLYMSDIVHFAAAISCKQTLFHKTEEINSKFKDKVFN